MQRYTKYAFSDAEREEEEEEEVEAAAAATEEGRNKFPVLKTHFARNDFCWQPPGRMDEGSQLNTTDRDRGCYEGQLD